MIFHSSIYFLWRDKDDVYALTNLASIDPQSRQAEFGVISLVGREGHAVEALRALGTFAFGSLGLNRLWCRVNEDNAACLALIAKHGALTKEGTLRQARFKGGRFVDQHIYAILVSEIPR